MIREYLCQPYPFLESKWKLIIAISLFIMAFMIVFQPFGLNNFQHPYKIILLAGYGLVCFIVLFINLFVIILFLKKWFISKPWTIINQIIWLLWIIFTIGIGNYLYSGFFFPNLGLYGFLVFQVYTIIIGIIPVVVLTILQHNFSLSQNLKSAKDLNSSLIHKEEQSEKQIICLIADNQKDTFKLELSDLLYIESTGNYIEVFYKADDKLKNTILRSTLKRTEVQLENYPSIVKCHRAFLVNIHKIMHVKGNSQGLKLVVKDTDTEIPVSRNLSKSLKDKINSYS